MEKKEYRKITILNPIKEQESLNSIVPGGNSYVTYLISLFHSVVGIQTTNTKEGRERRKKLQTFQG